MAPPGGWRARHRPTAAATAREQQRTGSVGGKIAGNHVVSGLELLYLGGKRDDLVGGNHRGHPGATATRGGHFLGCHPSAVLALLHAFVAFDDRLHRVAPKGARDDGEAALFSFTLDRTGTSTAASRRAGRGRGVLGGDSPAVVGGVGQLFGGGFDIVGGGAVSESGGEKRGHERGRQGGFHGV